MWIIPDLLDFLWTKPLLSVPWFFPYPVALIEKDEILPIPLWLMGLFLREWSQPRVLGFPGALIKKNLFP